MAERAGERRIDVQRVFGDPRPSNTNWWKLMSWEIPEIPLVIMERGELSTAQQRSLSERVERMASSRFFNRERPFHGRVNIVYQLMREGYQSGSLKNAGELTGSLLQRDAISYELLTNGRLIGPTVIEIRDFVETVMDYGISIRERRISVKPPRAISLEARPPAVKPEVYNVNGSKTPIIVDRAYIGFLKYLSTNHREEPPEFTPEQLGLEPPGAGSKPTEGDNSDSLAPSVIEFINGVSDKPISDKSDYKAGAP